MTWLPTSTYSGSWGSDLDRSIGNYQTRLGSMGYPVPAQNKNSTLSAVGGGVLKALDILDRPGEAVRVGIKYANDNKSFWKGAKQGFTGAEKYYGSDLLKDMGVQNKYARGIGGFAVDMALDPLNFVTLGAGSLAKGVIKGGATLSEKGLLSAENAAKVSKMHDAEIAVQKAHGAYSMKDLAAKLGGHPNAENAVKAEAFRGTTEAEFLRKARLEAQQRAAKNAGKGISVFGQSIVSGTKMQDLGGVINKGLNKVPGVKATGEAIAKGFDPAFVKGLDTSEREVLRQLRQKFSGENAVKDIQYADKFRNIAALQHGVTYAGKPLDRQILDIISKGGQGVPAADWGRVIATTAKQKEAAKALGLQENTTLHDLVNLYTEAYKGIGVKEHSEQVLADLVDAGKKGKITLDPATGLPSADPKLEFSTYVPHVVNREIDTQLRKGGMTRNLNVRNDFNAFRNQNYTGLSISEINEKIRQNAATRGQQLPKDYDFLETSALNAYMSRQLTSNKVLADKHLVNGVLSTFGKRIKSAADASQAMYDGYDIVVPKMTVNLFDVGKLPHGTTNVGQNVPNMVKSLLASNGGVLQKISVQDATNFIGNVETTMYAMPKGLADKFNKQATKQLNDGVADLGKFVDKFYSVWKPLVTGLRPQYHMRNLASSGFNNFLDLGVKMFDPATQSAAASVASAGAGAGRNISINIRGTKYTARQLHELMVEHGALNTFFLTDTNSMSKGISEDIARNNTGSTLGRLAGKPAELGRATGNRVEEYSRALNFIAHLKAGHTPAEAADVATKMHFDYQSLTDFEQGIKRVLPFYTWARKNIPLQVESFLNNPTPYLALSRAQQEGANMTGTDLEDLPDYARRDFAVPLGKSEDGRTRVLSAGVPAGDLFFNSKDLAGMLNPLAKMPLEWYTNQNFLTQGSLNSYPEESAVGLSEGNSLIAKALQQSPWLRAQLEAHPGAATAFAGLLQSTGIINDVNRYILPPQTQGGTLQGSRDANNTGGAIGFGERMLDPNMVKNFDPAKGAQSRDYQYQRQLGNIVQYLAAKGYTVPEMKDLTKKHKYVY